METIFDLVSKVDLTVALVLFIVVGPYVLLPIGLKLAHREPAVLRLEPFDLAREPLPTEVAVFCRGFSQALEPIGFSLVAHAHVGHETLEKQHVRSIITLLENRANHDTAAGLLIYDWAKPHGTMRAIVRTAQLSYAARMADGTTISTNNGRNESAFARRPQEVIVSFPDLNDLAFLYELHQRAVKEFGGSDKNPLPPTESLLEVAVEKMTEALEGQAAAGYFYLDTKRRFYRLTWKGAVLMTWKLLWPISAIRRAIRRARSRRLMERWGVLER